jgi:hypothetical protein
MERLKLLQEEILKEALPKIEKGESFSSDYIPYSVFIKFLEKNGFEEVEDSWDQNGWQVDFWVKFKKDKVIYAVGGSLYYGGVSIEKE